MQPSARSLMWTFLRVMLPRPKWNLSYLETYTVLLSLQYTSVSTVEQRRGEKLFGFAVQIPISVQSCVDSLLFLHDILIEESCHTDCKHSIWKTFWVCSFLFAAVILFFVCYLPLSSSDKIKYVLVLLPSWEMVSFWQQLCSEAHSYISFLLSCSAFFILGLSYKLRLG